jgi:aspartate kinase
MNGIVMKFGGSSVADAACMRQVAELVRAAAERPPLVVLSAMGKTTNGLFTAAKAAERGDLNAAIEGMKAVQAAHLETACQLFSGAIPGALEASLAERFSELELILRGVAMLRELSPRSMDAIASFGERLSTLLFSAFLGAPLVDARKVMRTDDTFGEGQPCFALLPELAALHFAPLLAPGQPIVTQGYIGATEDGLTTTLGRGGSDYSAALFGAALGLEEVQIWTDVQGVLTCDPRVVPEAQSIDQLTFAEAAELAAFGAKVLHPATIQPAVEAGIPVTVRDTRHPSGLFTTISPDTRSGRAVTALATRGPVTVLTVNSSRMLNHSGFLAKLFDVFRRHGVSVDLIATAEVSVSLTVEADAPLGALMADLAAFATVVAVENRAIIAVVGERIKQTPGIAGRVFTALGDINIELISMGANEINLSLVVPQAAAVEALRRLHRALIEEAVCV